MTSDADLGRGIEAPTSRVGRLQALAAPQFRRHLRVWASGVVAVLFVLCIGWGMATLASTSAVVNEIRQSQDLVIGNRQQGLVNRRATLCIGRGLTIGADDWDADYLMTVCRLSAEEAAFVLGKIDDLPVPDAGATVPDD